MKNFYFTFLIIGLGFFTACDQKSTKEATDSSELVNFTPEQAPISFESLRKMNPFPDAILEMYAPLYNQKFKEGKINFEFNIKNYPFGKSHKNHQLMLILNGGNPLPFETPNFSMPLKSGAYRAVAYLIDEEGLALKDFGNYVDREFRVGDSGPFPYSEEAYLAVNLPHNLQVYSLDQEIVVDFLVVGGDLKEDELVVKVKVNEWNFETQDIAPITIRNLPKGEYQVIISLERKDGKELRGPFSSVNKSIIVE